MITFKIIRCNILSTIRPCSTGNNADYEILTDQIERKPYSKLTTGVGGDINSCEILGKITSIKLLRVSKRPEQEWMSFFVKTILDIPSSVNNPITTHTRVHIFDYRLMSTVKRIKIGDRVYFSGFYSYYKPQSRPDKSTSNYRIGALVASRAVIMSKDPTILPLN